MSGLEQTESWPAIAAELDTLPLATLAGRYQTTPSAIVAAMRRTRVRTPSLAPTQGDLLPPEPGDDRVSPRVRPGSKDGLIEPFRSLLGQVPDADVADRAGVCPRTIAAYRARNGIAGYRGPRRASGRRGPRRSRIDPHVSLLGQVPDRVVAERAGVSLNAVRNYRVKRGIAAAGRDGAGLMQRPHQEGVQRAWSVTWESAGTETTRVVIGQEMSEILAQFEQLGLGAAVRAIRCVGELFEPSGASSQV